MICENLNESVRTQYIQLEFLLLLRQYEFFKFSQSIQCQHCQNRINSAPDEWIVAWCHALTWGCNSSSMTSKSYLLYHFDYLCAAPSYNNLEAARLPSPPILTFVGHDEKKNLSMIPFWTNFMKEKKEFIIKKVERITAKWEANRKTTFLDCWATFDFPP